MTTMKTLVAATLLALPLAVAAAPAEVDGTWACRTPGVDHGNTPPILYLGVAQGSATAIDVDGFSRTVFGIGDIVADAGGWWKVTPPQGAPFMVRPEGTTRGGRGILQVRHGGVDYRCYRVQPRTT
jgi:hypothetical protein